MTSKDKRSLSILGIVMLVTHKVHKVKTIHLRATNLGNQTLTRLSIKSKLQSKTLQIRSNFKMPSMLVWLLLWANQLDSPRWLLQVNSTRWVVWLILMKATRSSLSIRHPTYKVWEILKRDGASFSSEQSGNDHHILTE